MKHLLLLFTIFFSTITTQAHDDVKLKSGFVQELINDELVSPTSLTVASDGRIFITEKKGTVRIIENGILLDEPFLEVYVDQSGERGLGSIVLDPNFETNGYVYIYYTVFDQDFNRLSRFTTNGNTAVPGSEVIIMELEKLGGIFHNGGAMRFAPDGTLFLSVGDGSRNSQVQSFSSRLGKMLRINKDGSIPTDNPFYNELEGDFRSIYAVGFRNSFTFDLNKRTGQILANDVGLVSYEEVNDIKPGKNYGWPIIEGYRTNETPPENYQDPLYVYPHEDGMCAVVGGAFYEPETPNFPQEFMGKYIFSDYCTGIFHVMDSAGNVTDTLLTGATLTSNIVAANDGYLYYLSYSEGELWKVSYVGEGEPFISRQPKNALVVVGESASFAIETVGEDPISYQWFKNGNTVSQATNASLTLSNVQLTDSASYVYCRVQNHLDTIFSDTVWLYVTTNQRPQPVIYLPITNSKYDNGDTLWFAGNAIDPEEGELNADAITWEIDFHHDQHTHPAMPHSSGIKEGYFATPRLGETDTNVWYRVYLTATDTRGMAKTIYHEIYPNLADINLSTIPRGLDVLLDGSAFATPYTFTSTVGNTRVITAPDLQVRNDSLYRFVKWTHGDTSVSITFDAGQEQRTSYQAEYTYARRFFEGQGDGLKTDYYDNQVFIEPSIYTEIKPEVNFLWGYGSPVWEFPADSFSVRFTGSILAPINGEYVFTLIFDDEVELKLNNQMIIDGLGSFNGDTIQSLPVTLEGGKRYNIQLDYVELRWISRVKLYWSFIDQERQIIPQSFLYSDTVSINDDDTIVVKRGGLNVFPNPAEDKISLEWKDEINQIKTVKVYTVPGQEVFSVNWENNFEYLILDISKLKKGTYIAKVLSEGREAEKIFIKTR